MGTIGEEASNFSSEKTKNIADLKEVDTSLELKTFNDVDDEGKAYTYKYIEVNNERYRVPNIVLGQLKVIKEKKPNLKKFAVSKTGEGLQTRYMVISLD